MRCNKHLSDQSGTVGVCATCLRERLFILIAAHSQSQSHLPQQQQPFVFPRSVSPYVSRRKSDNTTATCHQHDHRFYSTPQSKPVIAATVSCKKKSNMFTVISNLFKIRSADPAISSLSCFYNSVSRKKQSRLCIVETGAGDGCRKPPRVADRGLSPDGSPSGSGSSSEGWQKSPVAGPQTSARGGKRGHRKTVSGIAFCLSPLVRASPNRNWKTPDMLYSGEVRAPIKPHLSSAASFCANRSRKIADFGRPGHR